MYIVDAMEVNIPAWLVCAIFIAVIVGLIKLGWSVYRKEESINKQIDRLAKKSRQKYEEPDWPRE